MKPFRSRGLLGLTLFGLVASASVSLAADGGSGSFHFGKVQFQPSDALAYQEDGKDPAKPVTVVVLADFKIDRAAVMEAINTPGAFMGQAMKNEGGNFVMVTMTSPDKCGLSGFLGKTQQQIGLSDSNPAKTRIASASRIAGECFTSKPGKMFDDTYEFRLSYDLPITTIPKPSPLPAGGGEPGIALVALVKAIGAADWSAARLHVRQEELPSSPPKASEMKNYFHGLGLNYPKTATVTGGLIKGGLAQLEIKGTNNDGKKVTGVFAMKKVSGNWQVLDYSLFSAE